MPDDQPRTLADFVANAPFETVLMEHDLGACESDTCGEGELALAQVTFTSWQADFMALTLKMALDFSEKNDREVVFADDPDGGHSSLGTLVAQRFYDYFTDLTDALGTIEEDIAEREDLAA